MGDARVVVNVVTQVSAVRLTLLLLVDLGVAGRLVCGKQEKRTLVQTSSHGWCCLHGVVTTVSDPVVPALLVKAVHEAVAVAVVATVLVTSVVTLAAGVTLEETTAVTPERLW